MRVSKTISILLLTVFSLIILSLAFWATDVATRNVEQTYRRFCDHIAKGDYQTAYDLMSRKYRGTETFADFTGSVWCATSNASIYHAAVTSAASQLVYVRVGISGQRARVIETSAVLQFPLAFEDGFIALSAFLVKEDATWRIDGMPNTIMR